jgi:hypothetical protein
VARCPHVRHHWNAKDVPWVPITGEADQQVPNLFAEFAILLASQRQFAQKVQDFSLSVSVELFRVRREV